MNKRNSERYKVKERDKNNKRIKVRYEKSIR